MPSARLYWRLRSRTSRQHFAGAWAWVDVHHGDLPRGRARWPVGTQDPAEAEQQLAALEARLAAGLPPADEDAPTVGDALDLHLREGLVDLAASTRRGVESQAERVREGLGELHLDELDERALWRWWRAQEAVSEKTRRNRLDVLAGALWIASQEGWADVGAVTRFRASLRRRGRGKAARASTDPARGIRAIESWGAIRVLRLSLAGLEGAPVRAKADRRRRAHTRRRGPRERAAARADYLAFLLGLDAGLRPSEMRGLRWPQVLDALEREAHDPARVLLVDRDWPQGGTADEAPKGGRVRHVPMSHRLQRALREAWLAAGRPGDSHVLPGFEQSNFHGRIRRACQRAKLPEYRPKDLRSTFASQLLSAGVPVTYIARLLGHSTTQLTETRYARWIPEGYREPERLREGEVVTDLMARLEESACAGTRRHTAGHTEGPEGA